VRSTTRPFTAILLALALLPAARAAGGAPDVGAREAGTLVPVARIAFDEIPESSALAFSRTWPGVCWTLNDSGDEARVFAIDTSGALIKPAWDEDYHGLRLAGAENLDWEDLALDDLGNLVIGAFGNNGNARRDLGVYVLPEPNPRAVSAARPLKLIPFAWPDQRDFPPAALNFDCEACFFARGALHFLTKHRADTRTRLYRLDPLPFEPVVPGRPWHEAFRADVVHPLTFLGEAGVAGLDPRVAGLVTAADATTDGRRVAILTYTGVFVVDTPPGGEAERTGDLLAGTWRWLPISAGQCEGLALDGERLWISNEQRDLFRVDLRDLVPYAPSDE
jgi:hypothetical protein